MTKELFEYFDHTPQILIIDDVEAERKPLAKIFKEYNVLQFDGSEKTEKYKNIRLIFLDLDLGDGVNTDNLVSTLYTYIEPTIINGPFLLILWTKHAEKKQNFIVSLNKYGQKTETAIVPSCIIALNKPEFQNLDRSFKKEELQNKILEELQNIKSVYSLIKWEFDSIEMIYKTVEQLNSVICDINLPTDQHIILGDLLLKISKAVAPNHTEELGSDLFQKYLKESLSVILADNIAYQFNTISAGKDNSNIDILFNTLMQLAVPCPRSMPPGCIFKMDTLHCIAEKIYLETQPQRWRRFVADFFGKEYTINKDEILNSVLPISVEITPPCDYANNKRQMFRFIAGLAIPQHLCDKILSHADYLFSIKNIIYPYNNLHKIGTLCFNFRYIFTAMINDSSLPEAILSLRSHVFSDLQANLGKNISRPGHLSIEIKN